MDTNLPEEKRSQLDGIVQKMVSNKESDSNIRFVVDDFKKKYSQQPAVQQQPQQSFMQNALGKVKSLAGGFASGVGGIALTAEDWAGRKIVNKFGSEQMKQRIANTPKLNEQFKQQMGGVENPGLFNTAQLGGEIASLAAPVGTIGKGVNTGAKALGLGNNASKLAQAGAEGVAFTAGSALTENKKASGGDYALNTALNVVVPGAGMIAKKIGNNTPGRVINSLIKPLGKDFSYGKNPGRTVAELVPVANNFDELIAGIRTKKNEVGQNIGTVIQKSLPQLQSQMDLNTLLSPIDEAIALANKTPRTNQVILSRLESVKADLVENIKNGVDPQSFKGLIGDITKWTGSMSDDKIVNKALKQVYGRTVSGMDDILKKELSPEEFVQYKKSSEQYGDLIAAENATINRDAIKQRADLVSFGSKNTALIGALTTAIATGGSGLETVLAGLGGIAIDKSMASPAFKTRLAKLLTKLAPNEVKTFFERVPTAKQLFKQKDYDDLVNRINENPNGGFVANPFAKSPKKNIKIHRDDLAEMGDFIDYKAGEYKPKNEADFKYYTRKMAQKYGIDANTSDTVLRNKFLKLLEENNFRN